MDDTNCSLPVAWKNGDLTGKNISQRHEKLLPDVLYLESDLNAVSKAVEGYVDALNSYCSAGSRVSSAFAKLLGETTLSNIAHQFQQVTDKLEQTALNNYSEQITNDALKTLGDFQALLGPVKQEIRTYQRFKSRYEKCQGNLESFAQKDAAASEGKGFQHAKEKFSLADRDYTEKQDGLSRCLSDLEGNRIKMVGASLLMLLHSMTEFNNDMITMLAPLGIFQSVGDYLRDREIAPQLKEAVTTWCSLSQSHQILCEKELAGEDTHNLLKYMKGDELSSANMLKLTNNLKNLLEDYKRDVESLNDGSVSLPGGFFKNPAGIRVALKGRCSRLESLAIEGVNETPSSYKNMINVLRKEIPQVNLAVASVGKPWHTVSNMTESDIVECAQCCLEDLIEPLAKQFDIPFTKESFRSFASTILFEAVSEKTILASKIAVQLLYGKDGLVAVELSPDSSNARNVRLHCKEKGVHIEVQLIWWVVVDRSLYAGLLDDNNEPLFAVHTTYAVMVNYMDYLEEKESRLPAIAVEYRRFVGTNCQSDKLQTEPDAPVAPPRSKHYMRKYADRKKKSELDGMISRSVGCPMGRTKSPQFDQGAVSHLSLASETELSDVINFLSGLAPRASPNEADTESLCSTVALSDSGIESVNNARLGICPSTGKAETPGQEKKGKKKDQNNVTANKNENARKKKKKKRGDRKKEKKKAMAQTDEPENGGTKDPEQINDDSVNQTQAKQSDDKVVISESLRSVWEQPDRGKEQQDREITPTNTLKRPLNNGTSQSSTLYGSQESIYYSCWSLPGASQDVDESVAKVKNNQEIMPTDFVGGSWGATQGQKTCAQRSIWSPVISTSIANMENFAGQNAWTPSLKRQGEVDKQQNEPKPVSGESVFSLGLDISGMKLVTAANEQARSLEETGERSMNGKRNFQCSMWPLASQGGRPTAGQFAERASSYEEGLHSLPHHEQLERARLPTHHSDPFLATKVPWRQGMSPMYMNYANKPRLVPPLARDMGSRGYTPVQSGRGFPAFVKPGPNLVERRGNSQQYYLRSRAGPLG